MRRGGVQDGRVPGGRGRACIAVLLAHAVAWPSALLAASAAIRTAYARSAGTPTQGLTMGSATHAQARGGYAVGPQRRDRAQVQAADTGPGPLATARSGCASTN